MDDGKYWNKVAATLALMAIREDEHFYYDIEGKPFACHCNAVQSNIKMAIKLMKQYTREDNAVKLEVQKYLDNHSLEDLQNEFHINVCYHPTLPLVGLKYNQIESPKYHPIVRECRGLVLEKDSWEIVAKAFNRFFNAGEGNDVFDWSCFTATEKVDGSLILFYNYKGDWLVNTSGSFGLGKVGWTDKTWTDLVWDVLVKYNLTGLEKNLTYVFELCSPYNKVVRSYSTPQLFLLSAFYQSYELPIEEVDEIAIAMGITRPNNYSFACQKDITEFLEKKEFSDPTFEGVVVRDCNNRRLKIKSKSYLHLHHLHDNGNLYNPKHLIPLVLKGEADEVVSYFPEAKDIIKDVSSQLDKQWNELKILWGSARNLDNQKDFALAIKHHPLSNILFRVRKKFGKEQSMVHLSDEWLKSEELIIKNWGRGWQCSV